MCKERKVLLSGTKDKIIIIVFANFFRCFNVSRAKRDKKIILLDTFLLVFEIVEHVKFESKDRRSSAAGKIGNLHFEERCETY